MKKKWIPAAAILLGAIAILWLVDAGVFRVAQPAAVVSLLKPPAALNTAADYLAQGDYEFQQGTYQQAIEAYSRALELNPNFPEAYNNRAYAYMTLQNYVLALPDLDKAIELRPNYVNALMNRGDIRNYYYDVDRTRAIQDYDRVLAIAPNTPSLCGHRMIAFHGGWDPTIYAEILINGVDSGCKQNLPPD